MKFLIKEELEISKLEDQATKLQQGLAKFVQEMNGVGLLSDEDKALMLRVRRALNNYAVLDPDSTQEVAEEVEVSKEVYDDATSSEVQDMKEKTDDGKIKITESEQKRFAAKISASKIYASSIDEAQNMLLDLFNEDRHDMGLVITDVYELGGRLNEEELKKICEAKNYNLQKVYTKGELLKENLQKVCENKGYKVTKVLTKEEIL